MLSALRRTAGERLTLRHLVGIAALLGALVALNVPPNTLVAVAWAVVVAEVVTVLRETPEIDQRYVKGAVGVAVALGSLGMAALVAAGRSGAPWLPAALAVAGLWLLADTAADFRRDRRTGAGRDDDVSSAEVMLLLSHGHVVADALGDGPRTVDELAADCDLTESRVRDALDRMEESGVVARDGDRYVLREENLGPVAFVRNAVAGAARRLARPFRG